MAGFKKFDPHAWLARERLATVDKDTTQNPENRTLLPDDALAGLATLAMGASQNKNEDGQNTPDFETSNSQEFKKGGMAKALKRLKPDGNQVTIADLSGSRPENIGVTFATLERRCPEYVEENRWRQTVADGRLFLEQWWGQAVKLGWTADELFGLHTPPANPHPSYHRLSRYDCTGLVWLLNGSPVGGMTADTAAIVHKSGSVTVYRKHNKPCLGPLGDSLDDFV